MSIVSVPSVTFNIVAAPTFVANAPQKVLFFGQQTDDTSTVDVLVTNIQPNGQESTLFGEDSALATMIRNFRKIDTISRVDAIPVNAPLTSNPAVGTVAFAGTATENGTFTFFVQSKIDFIFSINVTTGDTATTLADALRDDILANDLIMYSAGATTGTVTITSKQDGVIFNDAPLAFSGSVAGITVTLGVFATGTGSLSSITTLLPQIANIRYQAIVMPSEYPREQLKDFLDTRLNSTNAVLDGVGFSVHVDDLSTVESEALALDSQSMVSIGSSKVATPDETGSSILEWAPAQASQFAAIRALRLTEGANISNLLTLSFGRSNEFGGAGTASIPYHNTTMSFLPVEKDTTGWTSSEQISLNSNGVSFFGNNLSATNIITGDIVTTYLTNELGQADKTFKFLNAVDTASQVREFFFNNNKQNFAQSVLTPGDLVPNSRQVTIESFNAFQEVLYRTLTIQPFALTVAGDDALNFFKENITTTANFETGTISTVMIIPIVSQVRTINGTIQIAFDTSIA